jgi:hypothetical protein
VLTAGLESWVARGFVFGAAIAGLAIACGDESSSPPSNGGASGIGGVGQSGSPASGGAGMAGGGSPQTGGVTGGNPQGGLGGTLAVPAGGAGAAHGGEPGTAGSAGGGAPAGAGGEGAEGGANGAAGAAEQCDTTPVAQPPGPACAVLPNVSQEYRVGLATEVLSFGVRLRATGFFGPVHINEIEVHYYYSQEETSGFQPSVDSFVIQPGGVDLTASSEITIVPLDPKQSSTSGPGCQTHFIRIRNSSPLELPAAKQGEPYAEVHVTLTPNNPAPPNQNHADDHSYVPEATNWTETALLGVYQCGQLTSGCTPGDAGTCN